MTPVVPAARLREAARVLRERPEIVGGPHIAEPLAAWLDTHVEWATHVQAMVDDGLVHGPIDDRWPGLVAALALADAILTAGSPDA